MGDLAGLELADTLELVGRPSDHEPPAIGFPFDQVSTPLRQGSA